MIRALLLLQLAMPASTFSPGCPLPPTGPTRSRSRGDSLVEEHRYHELGPYLASASSLAASARGYLLGILDNRRNQLDASIQLLARALASGYVTGDTTRKRLALEALADDYLKTFHYAQSAATLRRIERELGATMSPADRESLRQEVRVRSLLGAAPPQAITVAGSFSVPARRNVIGLMEVPVRAGADSSWWILDTGANFSTITESYARELGLRLTRDTTITTGINGTAVGIHLATVPRLRLGRAMISNVVVLVLPDSALFVPALPYQIKALIGYPVAAALGRITVAPDRFTVTAGGPQGTDEKSNLYLEGLNPLITATVEGSEHLYHFDSGANHSTFSVKFCQAYPRLFEGLRPRSTSLTGVGSTESRAAYTIPALTIGAGGVERTITRAVVQAEAVPSPFADFLGNLGQDLIGPGGSYTLDFRRMTFIISP